MAARDVTEVGTALPKHVEALEIAKAHPDVETNNFHGLNLKILLVFVVCLCKVVIGRAAADTVAVH